MNDKLEKKRDKNITYREAKMDMLQNQIKLNMKMFLDNPTNLRYECLNNKMKTYLKLNT